MAKYDFFISYSGREGGDIARKVIALLIEKGYTVFNNQKLNIGTDVFSSVAEAIVNCDCYIPIITEKDICSKFLSAEIRFAISKSADRSKDIVPLVFTDNPRTLDLGFIFSSYEICFIHCDNDIAEFVENLDIKFGHKLKSNVLYEKLIEYSKLSYHKREAEVICQLIDLICERFKRESDDKTLRAICKELYRLYLRLESYSTVFDDESKTVAHKIIKAMDTVESLLVWKQGTESANLFLTNVYFSAFAVRVIYSDRIIRKECADILTNGDVIHAYSYEWYKERQRAFAQAFLKLFGNVQNSPDFEITFSKAERLFVSETIDYIFGETETELKKAPIASREKILTEEDEILVSVANFMCEGNKLLDVLQEKGIAGDFLKCLLTSYERLKNYCEIVGAKKVAAECIDRIIEIKELIDKPDEEPLRNEKVENGVKSLLGITLPGSGSYDVFISFKNEDSDLAEKVYRYCQRYMKEPFWSKKSLPQLSKSEYEDAIYDALRKAKHFVVVLSDLKYLESNWIKKEMSTFDRAITEGRKQDANFVFVVTDDVYEQIMSVNKMCLNERYCGYQILKISEYEETLIDYII